MGLALRTFFALINNIVLNVHRSGRTLEDTS